MKKETKKSSSGFIVLILLFILSLLIGGGYYCYQEFFIGRDAKIQVVSTIDDYSYYLNSNATRLYKKYYKLLQEELKDSKIDEENYVSLLAQLFSIDFYTLNNKITNQDVGGVQFIATSLQEKFRLEAMDTVYKYVQNNLSNQRKQKLPEVKQVEVVAVSHESYKNGEFSDLDSILVEVEISYVEDLGYPTSLKLHFIHEENKLVLVEFGENK